MALTMLVDICGEGVALEPDGDKAEVSEMQWQVEDMLANECGRQSGNEASLSGETPQMRTLREEGSERHVVGEKPREVTLEAVAEIALCEDQVVLASPEEARVGIPPGLRESGDPLV
ncbi:hypothetical protein HPB50_017025 [Hyalomma asiaticum]|uniref:Uncharacterized protein n=1 Tax=Hyalomma asiaticum TaxID=266040 RepID=A0ACB7RQ40_HYAAI|nr:hypothetical protein HPB50_017025 [Hyalomma asiaticum]